MLEQMQKMQQLKKCNLCPHKCSINRNSGKIGKCKATDKVKLALYSIHKFEEPCISGGKGSGTIFFSNCNLSCKYCQNYEISQFGKGKEITIEELAEIFLIQQNNKAENINLVTPTSYVLQIIEAIKIAKSKGLNIPIIYNTNSYENVETLKMLEGYIDVYLPDLKYAEDNLAKRFSNIENYFEVSTNAILEMIRQVGMPCINENGIIEKGVIVRHLVLPNHVQNSRKVLKWISNYLPKDIYVSVMAQYFPTFKAKEIKELNRKVTSEEWSQIENFIEKFNLNYGYIQKLGEHEEEYVPNWDI